MTLFQVGLASDFPKDIKSTLGRLIATRILILSMLVAYPFMFEIFKSAGLTADEFMLLQVTLLWSLALSEIPSGLIADALGRRNALTLASTLLTSGAIVLLVSRDISFFIVGECLIACGYSMRTGSDLAYISDLLEKRGLSKRFGEVWNYYTGYDLAGSAVLPLLGGLIFYLGGLRAPLVVSCIGLALSIGVSRTLPHSGHEYPRGMLLSQTKRILLNAWSSFRHDQTLRAVFLFDIVFLAVADAADKYQRPFLAEAGMTPIWQSVYTAVSFLIPGVLAIRFNRVISKWSPESIGLCMVLGVGLSIILVGVFPTNLAILMYLTIPCYRWTMNLVNVRAINSRIDSTARATVNSLSGMGARLTTGAVLFVMGMPAMEFDSQQRLIAIGVLGSATLLYQLRWRVVAST